MHSIKRSPVPAWPYLGMMAFAILWCAFMLIVTW